MRVLFDHDVPAPLRRYLVGHTVALAKENGWESLSNGDLLNAAEENDYEIIITADQSIRYQQNLGRRTIGVLVLLGNAWPKVQEKTAVIREALDSIQPGKYTELQM